MKVLFKNHPAETSDNPKSSKQIGWRMAESKGDQEEEREGRKEQGMSGEGGLWLTPHDDLFSKSLLA